MIAEADKEKIRKANIANIVRKVKEGKSLTKLELGIIEDQDEPTTDGTAEGKPRGRGAKRKAISVYALATETGIDQRTIRKRLVDAGLYPPENHPRTKVLDAIKPKSGDKDGDSIKERKTFEEWRKLKLANDENEALLIPRATVSETVRKLAAKFGLLLTSKLEQEYPATVAGLDVPAARIYGKKLNDQIRAEVQAWAGGWDGR